MTGIGILLLVLGIGSFILPMIGFQFRLMDLVEDYQPFAGIIVAVIGAVLLYLGYMQRAKVAAAPAAPPATPPAPPPAAPATPSASPPATPPASSPSEPPNA